MRKAKSNLHLEEYSVKFYLSFVSILGSVMDKVRVESQERSGYVMFFEKPEVSKEISENILSSQILYSFGSIMCQSQGDCVCCP